MFKLSWLWGSHTDFSSSKGSGEVKKCWSFCSFKLRNPEKPTSSRAESQSDPGFQHQHHFHLRAWTRPKREESQRQSQSQSPAINKSFSQQQSTNLKTLQTKTNAPSSSSSSSSCGLSGFWSTSWFWLCWGSWWSVGGAQVSFCCFFLHILFHI